MKISVITFLAAIAGTALALPVAGPEPEPESSPSAAHKLFARDPVCQSGQGIDVSVSDGNSCANMLIGYDERACVVKGTYWTKMCHNGGAYVWGRPANGQSTSSYCRDVGYGVQAIVNDCKENGEVAGQNFAGGNGNFELWLRNSSPN